MEFPEEFNFGEYCKWHNFHFPSDKSLAENLENFREAYFLCAESDIKTLKEYLLECKVELEQAYPGMILFSTIFSLPENNITQSQEYLKLFKEPTSIANKLWRKNRSSKSVCLANIEENILDLVRGSVSVNSLESCNILANHFKAKRKRKKYSSITSIVVEPEMKMNSGYFAYHIMIKFKSGRHFELQVYSQIVEKWRSLSHAIYKSSRLAPIERHINNTIESRIISLGHLFHLAECELARIEKEIEKKNKTRSYDNKKEVHQ